MPSPVENQSAIFINVMDMGTCIGKLALSVEFSDIRLVVGYDGEVFPAHKLILAARCEYFRKMFYGNPMKEARDGVCTFPYDDPRVFKTMLYHLYAKQLEDTPDPKHLVMCLVTAEKYGIDSFREFCLNELHEILDSNNVCEIIRLLDELYHEEHASVEETRIHCHSFVLANLESIIQEDALYHLPKASFHRLLQNPSLSCPEVELYKAVLSWHQHRYGDFVTQRDSLLSQLAMLDLKLIDLPSVAQLIHSSGVFSKDEMAEIYRLRITLGQFCISSRMDRKFALLFHAGTEYNSRPNDVLASLVRAGLPICDTISFTDKYEDTQRLQMYSSILLFSMETRSQGLCGDVLADYVDKGGCVVLCHALGCISGKIMTSAYLPVSRLEPLEGEFKSLELGKVAIPSHPLLEGVADIRVRCGPNFAWNCALADDAKLIAEWSDGTILACERKVGKGRVLFLNLYPVSTRVVIVGLERDSDGHILLRNALLYAAYHPCRWL